MKLAERTSRISESATVRVTRMADELRRSGVDLIDFGVGEPDFDSPPAAIREAQAALDRGFTKYTQASGTPELRAALAERYRRDYEAPWNSSDVVVTVGAKTALFELALALFDVGHEVILPSPYWVSFTEHIRFCGAEPVTVPLSSKDGFAIHAEPLLEAVTDRTRAILVNSPANPTGGTLCAEELRVLVEGCAERGLVLIADETYERFIYEGATHASAASLAGEFPETVVVISSFSKTYSMTGWRVGWIFAPAEVIQSMASLQSHSTSNPTSFAMAGALKALTESEEYVQSMIAEYAARRELVIPRLNELPGFSCAPPHGAFYAFPRVKEAFAEGRDGSLELSEFLLEKARVVVVPGAAFGNDDHIRISLGCSREGLAKGLDRMAEALGG